MWLKCLTEDSLASVVNRPMVDLNKMVTVMEISFYLDATAAEKLGFGAILNKKWIFGQWPKNFVK